jgi:hypothetical protein
MRQSTDARFRSELRQALESPFEPLRAAEKVIASADRDHAELALKEFAELPELAISTMLQAWLAADSRGLGFEAHSVPPDHPLEFARRRRVRITVDEEESAIHVGLSHVPTRHPTRVI